MTALCALETHPFVVGKAVKTTQELRQAHGSVDTLWTRLFAAKTSFLLHILQMEAEEASSWVLRLAVPKVTGMFTVENSELGEHLIDRNIAMMSGHAWEDSLAHWVDSRRGGGGGGAPIARPIGVMMILLACLAGEPACCHHVSCFFVADSVSGPTSRFMVCAREHGNGLRVSGPCVDSSVLLLLPLQNGGQGVA